MQREVCLIFVLLSFHNTKHVKVLSTMSSSTEAWLAYHHSTAWHQASISSLLKNTCDVTPFSKKTVTNNMTKWLEHRNDLTIVPQLDQSFGCHLQVEPHSTIDWTAHFSKEHCLTRQRACLTSNAPIKLSKKSFITLCALTMRNAFAFFQNFSM